MSEGTRGARIEDATAARTFILAGRARVTLVSGRTGARFTYQVRMNDRDPTIWFVSVLAGASNVDDYRFLGTIFGRSNPSAFVHGRKSSFADDAPSSRAFAWAWRFLAKGEAPPECEVWHEGRCGKCGRVLTVPESIASGIGPVCESRVAAAA